jgi:hypothetical protein
MDNMDLKIAFASNELKRRIKETCDQFAKEAGVMVIAIKEEHIGMFVDIDYNNLDEFCELNHKRL